MTMPWLLLTVALAQESGDLEGWSKPEADLPSLGTEPRISCCGFDRAAWRAILDPRMDALRACLTVPVDHEIRLRTTMTVAAHTGVATLDPGTDDPDLSACFADAFDGARWPGEPLNCTVQVSWPLVVLPPTDAER